MVKNIHNFRDFLDFYCKKNNENIFFLSETKNEEISYNDLWIIMKNFNFFFQKYNISSENKVLVLLDNSLELLITFLSSLYNSRIFVPINPNSGQNEINYIIKKTKPKLIVTSRQFKKKVNKLKSIKKFIIDKNIIKNLLKKNFNFKTERKIKKKNSISQILFTSGSTGNPKGVVLTEKSMLTNLFDICEALNIKKKNPKFLSITPLYHNNGQFIPTLLPIILNGSTFTISPDISLLNFWPTCKKFQINFSSVMATHINYFNTINKITKHSIEALFCGGAKLDKQSQKRFEKKFGIKVLCNYGLTETSSIASTESLYKKKYCYGSVGRVLKNTKVKIKKNGSVDGEILIKGENLFKNYYGDKHLTKSKFTNKWFSTGDIGFFDKKKNLHIKDRLDNMIIVSGENIYPSDVENYTNNYKYISLGIVCSVPDKITQNKLIFLYEGEKKIKYDLFYKYLKPKVARHKIPKVIYHVNEIGLNEIPKAPNKKILRNKIKNILKKKLLKKS